MLHMQRRSSPCIAHTCGRCAAWLRCWTRLDLDFMQSSLCRPYAQVKEGNSPAVFRRPAVCFLPPTAAPLAGPAQFCFWHLHFVRTLARRASACEERAVVGWALRPCVRASRALQQKKVVPEHTVGVGGRRGECVAQACFRAGLAEWACATMPGGRGFSPACVQGPGC